MVCPPSPLKRWSASYRQRRNSFKSAANGPVAENLGDPESSTARYSIGDTHLRLWQHNRVSLISPTSPGTSPMPMAQESQPNRPWLNDAQEPLDIPPCRGPPPERPLPELPPRSPLRSSVQSQNKPVRESIKSSATEDFPDDDEVSDTETERRSLLKRLEAEFRHLKHVRFRSGAAAKRSSASPSLTSETAVNESRPASNSESESTSSSQRTLIDPQLWDVAQAIDDMLDDMGVQRPDAAEQAQRRHGIARCLRLNGMKLPEDGG